MTAGTQPATRLGRYRLIGVLGTGGMGVVHEAELEGPHGFRKRVALKVLSAPAELVGSAIVEEARLGGLVHHPNVVSTLELAEADGRWFMSMELVEGPTASALVKERGALPARAALEIGAQAAAGLSYLHTLSIDGADRPLVHRDIKPSNLLIDNAGLVKIVDLGIAGFHATDQEVVGTPGYMAPEQYDGRSGPASDLFALGSTLYLLLTGERLLGGGTRAIARTLSVDDLTSSPAFRDALDPIDPAIAPVLARCLAFEASERWSDAGRLAMALRQILVRVGGPTLLELVRETPDTPGNPDATPTLGQHEERALPVLPDGPFIGRDMLLDALFGALQRSRMVQVVGPPGVGKSRLVLEHVHRRAKTAGVAAWVGASGLRSLDELLVSVARSVGLVVPDSFDADWLAESLAARTDLLVVLDHLEDLDATALAALAKFMANGPCRWVLTRRTAAPVEGVRRIEVGPLSDQASETLFRAASHRPVPDAVMRGLVDKLGGVPLSIEIAAAGTQRASPKNLLHDLPTLTDLETPLPRDGRRRGAGSSRREERRNRQLVATMQWSWEQLDDDARDALGQLSVFEAPFRIEDAEAVVRLGSGRWVAEVIDRLLGDRLLLGRGDRLSVLATVRSFARSSMSERVLRQVKDRHAHHFARLGTPRAIAQLDMAGCAEQIAMLSAARADLDVAFGHAVAFLPGALAGVATARLALVLYTGPTAEGLDIVDAGLDADHTPESLAELLRLGFVAAFRAGRVDRARVFVEIGEQASLGGAGSGHFVWMRGVLASAEERWGYLSEAYAEAERRGDLLLLAKVENSRSLLARRTGDLQAAERYEEQALRFARQSGSEPFVSLVLAHRAGRRAELGDLANASLDFMQALTLQKRCRSTTAYILTLLELGILRLRQGNLEDAARMLASCEERVRSLGIARAVPLALFWRGALAWMNDQPDSAVHLWEVALERAIATRHEVVMVSARGALANAALVEGQTGKALALLDAIPDEGPARERLDALAVRVRVEVATARDPSDTVAELEELAETLDTPWSRATVWLAKARRDAYLGRTSDAADQARRIADELLLTPRSPLRRALATL